MDKFNKDAIRLLDRLYKDLYMSDEVLHHSTGNQYDKFDNIKEYLDKLERIHERVSDTGRHIELLKKLYYDKYVIKKENIPESYFKHQQEIALERGFGHVEITDTQRKELEEEIINNQKNRLDEWLEYFLSEDAKVYPFWVKYWAFQGMLKLGNYDKAKEEFGRRTKDTIAPFADLNREALAMSIDFIIKSINKEEIDDKELDELVKTGSFQKIYSYIITKTLKEKKNLTKRNEGKWVKYNQGSDHMPLVNSLRGYNTGWCTAGESTAKAQLSMGDFYVYYTLDENGEYKIPRIAIRMEIGRIGEIRGVSSNQNLEPEMAEVVEEKIKDFPDKDSYYKKVNDMKKLTAIYKKHNNREELTKEELRFLYEIDGIIRGFGYENDPRILEIIGERNSRRADLAYVMGCTKDQVALSQREINANTFCFHGDLFSSNVIHTESLVLPKYIKGSLLMLYLTSAKGVTFPKFVGGDLVLSRLTSPEGLVLPEHIGMGLNLSSLTGAKGLTLPQTINGDLYLDSLTNADGLVLPQTIGKDLVLDSLTSAKGLVLPQTIGKNLLMHSLTNAEDIVFPKSIGASLFLGDLTTAEGLVLPQTIGKNLVLDSLTSAKGLVLPKHIDGTLDLYNLTNADGLILPKKINEDLFLCNVISTKGLILPEYIGGTLSLDKLTNIEGLIFPQTVGGYLELRNLINAKDIVFPKHIGGCLELHNLSKAENVVLPQTINGDLYLRNLTSENGLIIPEPLTYNIHLSEFKITPENINKYRKKHKLHNIKNILSMFKSKNNSKDPTHKQKQ